MNAIPPSFPVPGDATLAASAVGAKWAALQDAAAVVAMLAGIKVEQSPEIRQFPALIGREGGVERLGRVPIR